MNITAYHGSSTIFPFEEFDAAHVGSGIVSWSGRSRGFFFTSDRGNARSYTENFVAKVSISNVEPNPYPETHPPLIMGKAQEDHKIYFMEDVVDGQYPSDITVVPESMLGHIRILAWEFVGDEGTLFEEYDSWFDRDGEGEISYDDIADTLDMMDLDIDDLLEVPVFRKYYEQRVEGHVASTPQASLTTAAKLLNGLFQ